MSDHNLEEGHKEIKNVLEKYHLQTKYEMTFPIYKILPDEVQLALRVLDRHGMKINFTLVALK